MRCLMILAAPLLLSALPALAASQPGPSQPGYILPGGAVAIIGNDGMEATLAGINALVAKDRPGLTFAMTLKGSSTGLPALAADATLLAPLSRDAWRGELAGFKQIHDYSATVIRIGYSGWGPRSGGKTPPTVYVNKANPLPSIAIEALARAFTAGTPAGDINLWSQLGVGGEAGTRRIHLYGLRDNGGFATAFRTTYLAGLPFAARFEPLDTTEAVIRAVAADPYGIAITGWIDAAKVSGNVRILPVAGKDGRAATPARADVAAGRYPLAAFVNLYVDKAPGKPLDPLAKAYVLAALSDAGQAVIAAQADTEQAYLPLSAADLAVERAKVAAM